MNTGAPSEDQTATRPFRGSIDTAKVGPNRRFYPPVVLVRGREAVPLPRARGSRDEDVSRKMRADCRNTEREIRVGRQFPREGRS